MLESTFDFCDFFEKNYGLFISKSYLICEGNEFVFQIQTVDNQWFVFKIFRSSGAPSAARLAEISLFLTELSIQKIAVPCPVLTIKNEAISTIFFENKYLNGALFKWIVGQKIKRPTVLFYKKMGELTARMHQVARTFEKKHPFQKTETALTILDENYVRAVQNWLPSTLAEYGFSVENQTHFSDKLTNIAQQLEKWAIERPTDFGQIHTDLHVGNVLRKNQTLAIIDWDELAFGPFLLDLAIIFKDLQQFAPEKRFVFENIFLKNYQINAPRGADALPNFKTAIDLANLITASWFFNPENVFIRQNKNYLSIGYLSILAILND
jgi:Ser/Thr protein kinase RdoA (MazF antagonist)